MIIQNYQDLATSDNKKDCLDILEAGLRAADPENIISKFVTQKEIKVGSKIISLENYDSIHTVAFGKAGDSMTRAINAIIPIKSGIIVIPKGTRSKILGKKFKIHNSNHPTPDKTSVKAAKEVIKFLQNRRDGELVIFLVSGGASSLLAIPDDITLDDKTYVTSLLLKCGANIQEFNCVRKHLSKIKGGRMVENLKCDGVGLVMSDVQGDDLSVIASGPTHMDDTTFLDALNILKKYKIRHKTPPEVLKRLEDGVDGKIPETPKKSKIENYIIATNQDCLLAMEVKAKEIGYKTKVLQVFGNIKDATQKIMENVPEEPKTCVIFGGETTVEVLGNGTGGRSQDLVLRLLKNSQNLKKLVIASMGTDGKDGNSLFAGAITENITINMTTIKEFLKNSDSARFFQKQKSNIRTGLTHTNLMDIGVILR